MSYGTTGRIQYKRRIDETEEYKQLHWTKQLELYPLRDRTRWEQAEGDYNNRLDNWDDPEEEIKT